MEVAVALVVFTMACLFPSTANGEQSHYVQHYVNAVDSTYFSWGGSRAIGSSVVIGEVKDGFRFPPSRIWEGYSFGGVSARRAYSRSGSGDRMPRNSFVLECGFDLTGGVSVAEEDSLYLSFQMFAQGIDSLTVLYGSDTRHGEIPVEVTGHRFHAPTELALSSSSGGRHVALGAGDTLRSIRFRAVPTQPDGELVVGRVRVYSKREVTWTDAERRPIPLEDESELFVGKFAFVSDYGDGPVHKLHVKPGVERLDGLCSFVEGCLQRYSHYHLKSVSKEEVLDKHKALCSSAKNPEEYFGGVGKLLMDLQDSHLRVQRTNGRSNPVTHLEVQPRLRLRDVLKVYPIRDQVEVVAIFDSSIDSKIDLGDTIVEIDGIPICEYMERAMAVTHGSSKTVRQRKVTDRFFGYSLRSDSVEVLLEGDQGRRALVLPKRSGEYRRLVPEGFSTQRLAYRRIDTYAYMRIGVWNDDTFPFFYSYADSLLESSGVIIDLRGNPGGDLSYARLASCFMDTPLDLTVFPTWSAEFADTMSVVPDPWISLNGPVAVIVDGRTGCSSELFVSALRRARDNVSVIGFGRTAGEVALILHVTLAPFVDLVYNEGFVPDAFGRDLEQVGIFPDVVEELESYRDLAPYDDKLLRTAIRVLENRVGRP